MGDNNNSAFKFFDGERQRINGIHIQVISWLIYTTVLTISRS
jgi:hypothetical protein